MSKLGSNGLGRLATLAAGAALTTTPVLGQGAGGDELTEITVTARKVEERLLDVPLTITAFTAKDIEAAGFTSIRDVAESTPGLFISSSQGRSGDRIAMRGINTVSPTQGYVGVYVDGVFVGSGIFKSGDPALRAAAIVKATTFYDDPDVLAKVSRGLGEAMVGINVEDIAAPHRLASRGW